MTFNAFVQTSMAKMRNDSLTPFELHLLSQEHLIRDKAKIYVISSNFIKLRLNVFLIRQLLANLSSSFLVVNLQTTLCHSLSRCKCHTISHLRLTATAVKTDELLKCREWTE